MIILTNGAIKMENFDIEIVLKAARKDGFENIAGGADEDSIWVGDYFIAPNDFKLNRLYNNHLAIKPLDKNFMIEVHGWKQNVAQITYKVKKEQLADGHLDIFLVNFFNNFKDTYCNTLEYFSFPCDLIDWSKR